MTGLYVEDGVEVTTHSMIKAFGRCPKQTQYKYAERLKKRMANERDKPLRRGTWLHSLLEVHYNGGDWKTEHLKLSMKFGELFDEERDALGDLPRECAQLMRAYLWHYGANKSDRFHGWRIQAVEKTLECPWPDGRGIYRGRVDLLVEDDYGLWIVDHKSNKRLPDLNFRLLDFQSALYIWAAWMNDLPVRGFIWNYIRTKAPGVPTLAYAGTARERLSTVAIDTEFTTYYTAIRDLNRLNDPVAKARLAQLKSDRWEFGKPQTSTFFYRGVLEKDEEMISRVVGSAMRTRDAMHDYDFKTHTETVERHVDRSCSWCDYRDLCTTELFGGNAGAIRKQQYRIGDPMDYYQDQKEGDTIS